MEGGREEARGGCEGGREGRNKGRQAGSGGRERQLREGGLMKATSEEGTERGKV